MPGRPTRQPLHDAQPPGTLKFYHGGIDMGRGTLGSSRGIAAATSAAALQQASTQGRMSAVTQQQPVSQTAASRFQERSDEIVKEIEKLPSGSVIEIKYYTGSKIVTDTFVKQYVNTWMGSGIAWVNTTENGWANSFVNNAATIKSALHNRKVRIVKRQ